MSLCRLLPWLERVAVERGCAASNMVDLVKLEWQGLNNIKAPTTSPQLNRLGWSGKHDNGGGFTLTWV